MTVTPGSSMVYAASAFQRARERRLRSLANGAGTAAVLAVLSTSGVAAQATTDDHDGIDVLRSEAGRMWPFEHVPASRFEDLYGVRTDSAWLAHARLAALRIPGCSAAFVSPNGLVATNHHCARNAITSVQQEGENLLDTGYFATTASDERRISDYHVDQLVAVEDVSDEILTAEADAADDAARQLARRVAMRSVIDRLGDVHHTPGTETRVEIVALYHGGRHSAYVFRRYGDVRLVAAPELQVGFFGGDPDNFTYPRYALDYTFYRVYGSNGEPLRSEHYFPFSNAGAAEGDAVFVVGNPGRTSRLLTVAQLEFLRDVQLPVMLAFLESRLRAMRDFLQTDRDRAEALGLRNRIFSLSNAHKGSTGRLAALQDSAIMARKVRAEAVIRAGIDDRPVVHEAWGAVPDSIALLQTEKRLLAQSYAAFYRLGDAYADARTIRRALALAELNAAERAGLAQDSIQPLRARLLAVGDYPYELELRLLEERFRSFLHSLGVEHPVTRAALRGRTVEEAAREILEYSVLADSARLAAGSVRGLDSRDGDPGVALAETLAVSRADHQRRWSALAQREARLNELLGRARFAVFGTDLPPDGTGSPRISDGVVAGYPYNGTMAPTHTTFFGLYERHHAFGPGSDWDLPPRWSPIATGLELDTPLNFVSTADTFSGNSGSPAITPALELVGLNFDRNIEGLSRDYIYLPERGRNVMVDVRAIRASLKSIYGMDRLVTELDGTAAAGLE